LKLETWTGLEPEFKPAIGFHWKKSAVNAIRIRDAGLFDGGGAMMEMAVLKVTEGFMTRLEEKAGAIEEKSTYLSRLPERYLGVGASTG